MVEKFSTVLEKLPQVLRGVFFDSLHYACVPAGRGHFPLQPSGWGVHPGGVWYVGVTGRACVRF